MQNSFKTCDVQQKNYSPKKIPLIPKMVQVPCAPKSSLCLGQKFGQFNFGRKKGKLAQGFSKTSVDKFYTFLLPHI